MALFVGTATVVAVAMWRTHARGAALLSGPRDWVACIGMLACHALNGTRILTARGGRRVASPLAAALGMVLRSVNDTTGDEARCSSCLVVCVCLLLLDNVHSSNREFTLCSTLVQLVYIYYPEASYSYACEPFHWRQRQDTLYLCTVDCS